MSPIKLDNNLLDFSIFDIQSCIVVSELCKMTGYTSMFFSHFTKGNNCDSLFVSMVTSALQKGINSYGKEFAS